MGMKNCYNYIYIFEGINLLVDIFVQRMILDFAYVFLL